jgi:hypothetical protein
MIQGRIPPRAFEIIRNRICEILVAEFANQYTLSGDVDADRDTDLKDVKIWMERLIPFSVSELPAINVGIERGDYANYHQGQADGDYRFFMECNTSAPTNDSDSGDTNSKVWVHKLMGMAQAIITDPLYKILNFRPGQYIKHHHVESFVFAESTRQDAENVTMARTAVVVKAVETNALLDPGLIAGQDTHVKLHETDKGYYFSIDF